MEPTSISAVIFVLLNYTVGESSCLILFFLAYHDLARLRKLDNRQKRGWWIVANEKKFEQVKAALHGRGIRERLLHRVLLKDNRESKNVEPCMFSFFVITNFVFAALLLIIKADRYFD